MHKDYVIIGGGVAGLCAAIKLTELGANPLIIEAGEYPSHKVCGEFFSPECMPILNQWNIYPREILKAQFHGNNRTLNFEFPRPAGSLSHIEFDPMLVQHAKRGGAILMTNCKTTQISQENNGHRILLSTGENIFTKHLIIATGRIPNFNQASPTVRYMGLKAHYEGIHLKNSLQMFAFKNAYLGISPIENSKYNIACLANIEIASQWDTPQLFIEHLMSKSNRLDYLLNSGKSLFPEWMCVSVPLFGLKDTPNWPTTYFIGDAAGTIPPITGDGLSMAIRGGIMAAEYAIRNDATGFKKAWRAEIKRSIFFGKMLHEVSTNPFLGSATMKLAQAIPAVVKVLYRLTR